MTSPEAMHLTDELRSTWRRYVEAVEDSDEEQQAFSELTEFARVRPSDVLDAAEQFALSAVPDERDCAATVLGWVCEYYKLYVDRVFPMLARMLENETDREALISIGNALGRLHDTRCVPLLLALKDHPDEHVRFQVAVGLPGCLSSRDTSGDSAAQVISDPQGLTALMELMDDPDTDVRDWATFGLGSLLEGIDSSEIRAALLRRTADPDPETCGEALVGLARRGDLRVVPPLLAALTDRPVSSLEVEAAAAIGDPRLLPALLQLKQRGWDSDTELLENAIRHCTALSDREAE